MTRVADRLTLLSCDRLMKALQNSQLKLSICTVKTFTRISSSDFAYIQVYTALLYAVPVVGNTSLWILNRSTILNYIKIYFVNTFQNVIGSIDIFSLINILLSVFVPIWMDLENQLSRICMC